MTELDNAVLNKLKANVLNTLGEDVPEQYLNPTDDIDLLVLDSEEDRTAAFTYIVLNECLLWMRSPLVDEQIKEHIKDYSAEFLAAYLDDCVNKSKKEIIAMHTDYIKKRVHDDFSMEVICD